MSANCHPVSTNCELVQTVLQFVAQIEGVVKNRTIHARIDEGTYEEIEFLKRDLGFDETTQVVSFALSHLFRERVEKRALKSPFERIEELELMGALKGPPDLSENYKSVITKSLSKKHGVR